MNYYHAFSVSFNWWFVLIPMMLGLVAVFGWTRPIIKSGRIKLRATPTQSRIIGILVAFASGYMMLAQSFAGVIQLFDNASTNADSPAWSLLFASFAITGLACIFGGIAFSLHFYFVRKKARKLRKLLNQTRELDDTLANSQYNPRSN